MTSAWRYNDVNFFNSLNHNSIDLLKKALALKSSIFCIFLKDAPNLFKVGQNL